MNILILPDSYLVNGPLETLKLDKHEVDDNITPLQ